MPSTCTSRVTAQALGLGLVMLSYGPLSAERAAGNGVCEVSSREGMGAAGEHLKGWPAQARGGSSVLGSIFKVFAPSSSEAAWFLSSAPMEPGHTVCFGRAKHLCVWPARIRPGELCPAAIETLRRAVTYLPAWVLWSGTQGDAWQTYSRPE